MSEHLRRVLPALCVVVAGLVAGGVLLGGGEASEGTPPVSVPDAPSAALETSRSVGEPSGQGGPAVTLAAEEMERPEVAAVRFLELTEDVVRMAPEEGARAQRSIASSASADRLSQEVFETLTGLANGVPGGVEAQIAPLGVRSVETSAGWDVSIWYVEVVVYGNELAVEQWRTATYSLVDEDGEWRMDALVSTDGPVPTRPAAAVAWATPTFIAGIAGFDDEVLQP